MVKKRQKYTVVSFLVAVVVKLEAKPHKMSLLCHMRIVFSASV